MKKRNVVPFQTKLNGVIIIPADLADVADELFDLWFELRTPVDGKLINREVHPPPGGAYLFDPLFLHKLLRQIVQSTLPELLPLLESFISSRFIDILKNPRLLFFLASQWDNIIGVMKQAKVVGTLPSLPGGDVPKNVWEKEADIVNIVIDLILIAAVRRLRRQTRAPRRWGMAYQRPFPRKRQPELPDTGF